MTIPQGFLSSLFLYVPSHSTAPLAIAIIVSMINLLSNGTVQKYLSAQKNYFACNIWIVFIVKVTAYSVIYYRLMFKVPDRRIFNI